jgi:hypothetical protein
MKKELTNILQTYFNVKLQIQSTTRKSSQDMEKLLFTEVVRMLQDLRDRSEVLAEMGLDLTEYETAYYNLIQNLLRMNFSDAQIGILNFFIYKLPDQEDFTGMLEVRKGRKVIQHAFTTPEDLWEVLKFLK